MADARDKEKAKGPGLAPVTSKGAGEPLVAGGGLASIPAEPRPLERHVLEAAGDHPEFEAGTRAIFAGHVGMLTAGLIGQIELEGTTPDQRASYFRLLQARAAELALVLEGLRSKISELAETHGLIESDGPEAAILGRVLAAKPPGGPRPT